ncbi:MAG: hypothetical protein RJQ10_04815 [Haliea sp.]|uniref:hypothetical protein n=1 Tax=Haliea sp. TaxID=1932666 RepID=UPI0032EDA137
MSANIQLGHKYRVASLFVLLFMSGFAHAEQQDVIEFFHPLLGHYFMAAGSEVELLDQGGAGGNWVRTGQSFSAWRDPADAPATAFPVCRFYSYARNSHFYTGSPTECESVRATDPGWVYEGIAFYIETQRLEDQQCAAGLVPVIRAYNDRFAENDSNHRYMTLPSISDEMNALGWIVEGVAMCARASTTNSGIRPDEASMTVRTDTSATVETFGGAQVSVPIGAVAPTPDGDVGSATITIAIDTSTRIDLPEGDRLAGRVYEIGPAGHVFQAPVQITLPVTTDPGSASVELYTLTREGIVQGLGGRYDPVAKTVTAFTSHFSPHWPGIGASRSGESCIQVDNSASSPYSWKNFCLSKVNSLADPFNAPLQQEGGMVAPASSIGVSSKVKWSLPAGNYDVCVEETDRDTQSSPPEFQGSKIISGVNVRTLDGSGGPTGDFCSPKLNVSNISGLTNARCACGATIPTPGGTGVDSSLEISLDWRSNPPVDLDIYVTEPGGETIFFDNEVSAAGGSLDWDNQCSNYQDGRTENVSWTSPPIGSYKIEVDCFDACTTSSATVPFKINVKAGGSTSSYSGQAVCGEDRTFVADFNFQGRSYGHSGRALYDFQPATLSLVFNGTAVTGKMVKIGVCENNVRLTQTTLNLVGTLTSGSWDNPAQGARIDGTWTGGDAVCGNQLTLADGYPVNGTFTILRGTDGKIALERLGDVGNWKYEFR